MSSLPSSSSSLPLAFSPSLKGHADPPRFVALSTARRHKKGGEHHGHHAAVTKPVSPDAFSAPLVADPPPPALEAEQQQAKAESSGEEDAAGVGVDKKTCWRENLKGKVFWFLRTMATALD